MSYKITYIYVFNFFIIIVICESGTFQYDNMCKYCDIGSYSPAGSTKCLQCPDGKTTAGLGYSSLDDCFGTLFLNVCVHFHWRD